jgi:acetylornithine deacetylase/succinyl-diaminopimelate desuccinylase-like protein
VLLARYDKAGPAAPTVLLYGHYDVQPPDPLNEWVSPPFEPTIRDGAIYARGASDDKGQLYAHVKAMEALLNVNGSLPVNVILLAEGEEEIGSPELEKFITAHAGDLRADHAVISDSEFFARGVPTITYALRGLVYLELTVKGPSFDLHSGLHGGVLVNPLNALAEMIAAMRDGRGRITLPGFYDDVAELTPAEREEWAQLPFDEKTYAKELGAELVGGEAGLDLLTRRWARPTLDCHGIIGGYQGEGSKTVIPASATAKISMRLVANQRPEKVAESFRAFVAKHTPRGVTASVEVFSGSRPVMVPPDGPAIAAAREALAEAFGGHSVLERNGASIPITELFQRVLKVDPIVMGFGLPEDRLHSPNERFELAQYHGGIRALASLMLKLARLGKR